MYLKVDRQLNSSVSPSGCKFFSQTRNEKNLTQMKRSTKVSCLTLYKQSLNPIQDGPFRGCSRMGSKRPPNRKICHTYPTMMKLGTVIPYLKRIQKIYESCDTSLEFCLHQHFFTMFLQILLYQEIQI